MSQAPRKAMGGRNALDDLVMIDVVQEDKILECLKNRYLADSIYTNIGPVLIAINPFQLIKPLYTEARIREYRGKKFFEVPPHVYALADDTYNSMLSYRENQCVIITGESGSGKTETSKIIMQYISSVSGKSLEIQRVKDRMLGSNPVLEAFGNAKTVNNNNSSRFGKYMEILFNFGGDPVGGRVTNYLLEKSRVVAPSKGERNFHVFYQIANHAEANYRQQFCINTPDYYFYLSQSECFQVDGIDDGEEYAAMMEGFRTLGVTEDELSGIHNCVSVVLWLGNIAFQENDQEQSAVYDRQVLDIVAQLLQVKAAALEKCLCQRKIQTGVGARAEIFDKPNTAAQADFCRDTLAKAMYSKLFDAVVYKVNVALGTAQHTGVQIGVLDIYGFEIFQYNSFEQLCINFVNEKLQQIFIELTLKAEQEEYVAEGIPWKEIKYYNNKPVCDLIEMKPGVLSICDDCCASSKSDSMFLQDMERFFGEKKEFKSGTKDFMIQHYAGNVRYEADGFLTKNKDTLFDDLTIVMQQSNLPFVRMTGWFDIKVEDGQKKRPITVGTQFKQQVLALMTALRACTPHYIRCIKPNHSKKPNEWDNANIKRQVKYLGLLENVNVRRAGYAHRSAFDRFVSRYKLLCDSLWSGKTGGTPASQCEVLCRSLGWNPNKEYAMGKTKIFIQDAAVLFHLEDLLDRKQNEAVIQVQKAWRSYKQKRERLLLRADCYDLVNGKKERRRGSINRDYKGDYVDFSYNKMVAALLSQGAEKEKVLFADRMKVAALRGKASFFSSLFGGKPLPLYDPRFIVVTDKAVYNFSFMVDPLDQKVKVQLHFRVTFDQIQSVVMSPFADCHFVLHFTPASGILDTLQTCRRKTELAGVLQTRMKAMGRSLDIRFQNEDTIKIDPKKNRIMAVKWLQDPQIDINSEKLVPIKRAVEIRCPPGLSGSSVPVPVRPQALDASNTRRPMLRAIYDCPGNGVDELGFKVGDMIAMISPERDGWYEGSFNGKSGFVPATYVERVAGAGGGGAKKAVAKPMGGGGAGPMGGGGGAGGPRPGGGMGGGMPAGGMGGPKAGGMGGGAMGGGMGGGMPKAGGMGGAMGGGMPKAGGMGGAMGGGMGGGMPKAGGAMGGGGAAKAGPAAGGGVAAAKAGMGGGGGMYGGAQPKAAAGPPKAAAKSDWSEQFTDDGDKYYYNSVTQESSWEPPPGFNAGGKAAPAAAKKGPCPWAKILDDGSGEYYYFNATTNESTWDEPPGFY